MAALTERMAELIYDLYSELAGIHFLPLISPSSKRYINKLHNHCQRRIDYIKRFVKLMLFGAGGSRNGSLFSLISIS